MTSPTIMPTRNTEWGFWGSISHTKENAALDVSEAWALAFTAIAATTGAAPEGVRDFLDSRDGRHFADAVADELARGVSLKDAIEGTVARWMGWRIDRRTSGKTGIPVGLPFLTGVVTHSLRDRDRGRGRGPLRSPAAAACPGAPGDAASIAASPITPGEVLKYQKVIRPVPRRG